MLDTTPNNTQTENTIFYENDDDIEAGDVIFDQENIKQPSLFSAAMSANLHPNDTEFIHL